MTTAFALNGPALSCATAASIAVRGAAMSSLLPWAQTATIHMLSVNEGLALKFGCGAEQLGQAVRTSDSRLGAQAKKNLEAVILGLGKAGAWRDVVQKAGWIVDDKLSLFDTQANARDKAELIIGAGKTVQTSFRHALHHTDQEEIPAGRLEGYTVDSLTPNTDQDIPLDCRELYQLIDKAFSHLDAQGSTVLRLNFGLPLSSTGMFTKGLTYGKIGEILGLSGPRVRDIKMAAIRKLLQRKQSDALEIVDAIERIDILATFDITRQQEQLVSLACDFIDEDHSDRTRIALATYILQMGVHPDLADKSFSHYRRTPSLSLSECIAILHTDDHVQPMQTDLDVRSEETLSLNLENQSTILTARASLTTRKMGNEKSFDLLVRALKKQDIKAYDVSLDKIPKNSKAWDRLVKDAPLGELSFSDLLKVYAIYRESPLPEPLLRSIAESPDGIELCVFVAEHNLAFAEALSHCISSKMPLNEALAIQGSVETLTDISRPYEDLSQTERLAAYAIALHIWQSSEHSDKDRPSFKQFPNYYNMLWIISKVDVDRGKAPPLSIESFAHRAMRLRAKFNRTRWRKEQIGIFNILSPIYRDAQRGYLSKDLFVRAYYAAIEGGDEPLLDVFQYFVSKKNLETSIRLLEHGMANLTLAKEILAQEQPDDMIGKFVSCKNKYRMNPMLTKPYKELSELDKTAIHSVTRDIYYEDGISRQNSFPQFKFFDSCLKLNDQFHSSEEPLSLSELAQRLRGNSYLALQNLTTSHPDVSNDLMQRAHDAIFLATKEAVKDFSYRIRWEPHKLTETIELLERSVQR